MSMRGLAIGGIKLEKRPYWLAHSFPGTLREACGYCLGTNKGRLCLPLSNKHIKSVTD
jgi:hypothetical protein